MRARSLLPMSAWIALATLQSLPANAGCGCASPPPPLQVVRPAFASPGDTITLFPPEEHAGRYEVRLGWYKVQRDAVFERDLADGRYKWQLTVQVPRLALGPTAIDVKGPGGHFTVPSSDFTVMQAPLALTQNDGVTLATCYTAAVTASHVVLIPLDLSAIHDHVILDGLAEPYPLRFAASDVLVYDTQGFLMPLSSPDEPGVSASHGPGGRDSLELTYDRHELTTHLDPPADTHGSALDPSDPTWHPEVDQGHLVLAIKGTVENQGPPPAGQTPPFDLSVVTVLADSASPSTPATRALVWSSSCSSAPPTRN